MENVKSIDSFVDAPYVSRVKVSGYPVRWPPCDNTCSEVGLLGIGDRHMRPTPPSQQRHRSEIPGIGDALVTNPSSAFVVRPVTRTSLSRGAYRESIHTLSSICLRRSFTACNHQPLHACESDPPIIPSAYNPTTYAEWIALTPFHKSALSSAFHAGVSFRELPVPTEASRRIRHTQLNYQSFKPSRLPCIIPFTLPPCRYRECALRHGHFSSPSARRWIPPGVVYEDVL